MTDTTTTTTVPAAGHDPAEVLDRAADIVLLNGWVQGALLDYDAAARVGVRAAPVCANGAIRIASGCDPDEVLSTPAEQAFAAWLSEHGMLPTPSDPCRVIDDPAIVHLAEWWASFEHIAEWNDHPARTLAQVAATLRRAARDLARRPSFDHGEEGPR
jgi:hypothetical protein